MIGLVCLAVTAHLGLTISFAQEWSAAQKEVWKTVEASLDAWAKGDLEGVYENMHRDFTWWTYRTAVPGNRASAKVYDRASIDSAMVVAHDARPLTILVYDTFAAVNYYSRTMSKTRSGDLAFEETRTTDVLKKEGGEWLVVATHWGRVGDD